MKNISIYRFLFLIVFSTHFGNQNVAQSDDGFSDLLKKIHAEKDDALKVDLYNKAAERFLRTEPSQARYYADSARIIGTASEYWRGVADAWNRIGLSYYFENDFEQAKTIFLKGLKIFENEKDTLGIGKLFNQIALCQKTQGDLKAALESHQKALDCFLKIPDNEANIALAYNNIGGVYQLLGKHQDALDAYHKSLEIREPLGNEERISLTIFNLGGYYLDLFDFQKALELFEKSLLSFKKTENTFYKTLCYKNIGNIYYHLEDLEKALVYYDSSLSIVTDEFTEARIRNNIATVLTLQGHNEKALKQQLQSKRILEELESPAEQAEAEYNIGLGYFRQKQYPKAISHFEQSFTILDTLEESILMTDLLWNLSRAYKIVGQEKKALEFNFRYNLLRDSLNNNFRDAMIFNLRYEEQRHQNEVLQKKVELERTKQRQKMTLITAGGIVLIAILLLLWYRKEKVIAQKNEQLARQNEQIALQNEQMARKDAQQKVDILLKEMELKSVSARLKGQEDTQKSIAKELHDHIGSLLSTIKLVFGRIEKKIDVLHEGREPLEKAAELLDKACDDVRKLSHNMLFANLNKFGLVPELKKFAEDINSTQKIHLKVYAHNLDNRLDSSVEEHIYRIIQELVSNALKHANAEEMSVSLNRNDANLNIMIEDDGVGFSEEEVALLGGVGLKNVASRVFDLGGQWGIDSRKGHGTTVSIDLHIKN